ncbi:PKD domain-containing protein [Carboxylicivirga marina]|uniref:PKD domain-containing protein n=1 Tax=Carboxylicivirga marina TaxID=2800988 RepID=UPI00259A6EE8|nr:PKD domain-containing protein [uncultured Carboxylicivirga sp.]
MGVNTQALGKLRLIGRIASLMLILSLLVGVEAIGQANVNVCQNGVVRLADYLTLDAYVVDDNGDLNGAPNGHLEKGYWSNTAGLTFSNINDPNAIISGFEGYSFGDTFTLTWYHGPDQTYDITIELTNIVSPEFELRNEANTTNAVLFCPNGTPNSYTFNVVEVPEPGTATINAVDYVLLHNDGTQNEITGATNPETINLNAGNIGYQNEDIFFALVESGSCLDITTNRIQLAEVDAVAVQIQGGGSACDPDVFDGTNVLEVLPYDPGNFQFEWFYDSDADHNSGNEFSIGIDNTYTLTGADSPGYYYVDVSGDCDNNGTPELIVRTADVYISNVPLPPVSIIDNPYGSGVFGMCFTGTTAINLTTELDGNVPVGITAQYNWFQNGQLMFESTGSTFPLNSDESTAGYNAFGQFVVEIYNVDNPECVSVSEPVQVNIVNAPLAYNVTGTDICKLATSTTSINIGVDNSEPDVRYLLLHNGVEIEYVDRSSTGSFIFPTAVSAFGTYTVIAQSGTCADVSMTGQVSIYQQPSVFDVSILEAQPHCEGTNYTFEVSGSETNVIYRLFNGATEVASHIGDGNPFSIPNISASGTYSLIGYSAIGSCSTTMNPTTSMTINALPILYNVTGADVCEGITVDISLSATEAGVSYSLYVDNGVGNTLVTSQVGSANFTGVSAVGTYTILATNTITGCERWMDGDVIIDAALTDVSFLAVSPGYVCGTGNITIPVGEKDVLYTLHIDIGGGAIPDAKYLPILGNGTNSVSFSGLNEIASYTILAERGTCSQFLSDELIIEQQPINQNVTYPVSAYCQGFPGVPINIETTELGINYFLVDDAGNEVDFVTGDGNPRSFANVTEGLYSVEARTSSLGCNLIIEDNINIVEFALEAVNPNIPSDLCIDDGPQLFTGMPNPGLSPSTTGEYKLIGAVGFASPHNIDISAGTLSFDPADGAAGTYIIDYYYTDNNGCLQELKGNALTIHDLNNGVLNIVSSIPAEPCQDDNTGYPLVGQLNGSPVSGVFSCSTPAAIILDSGSYKFNPSLAGNGTHTIFFDYTDPVTNCTGSTSIIVNVGIPISIVGLANEYCANDNTDYPLRGYIDGVLPPATVDNSTFEIIDPGNNTLASGIVNNTQNFNANQLVTSNGGTTGVYKVIYRYYSGSCLNELIQEITITKAPDAWFTFPKDTDGDEIDKFCINHGGVELTAVDPDIANYSSQFSLNGSIIGTGFNTLTSTLNLFPSDNTITHRVDNNGCIETVTRTFSVSEPNESIIGLCSAYFESDASFTISASELEQSVGVASFEMFASDGSNVNWLNDNGDNTATIDPDGHVGTNYRVVMTFVSTGNGCEQVVEGAFDIYPQLDFLGIFDGDKICNTSGIITLTGVSMPAGATASFTAIAGLSNTVNGVATIDPSAMSIGINTLEYILTGADGCTHTVSKQIEIIETPSVLFDVMGGGVYCSQATVAGQTIGLNGSSPGVSYELLLNGGSLSIPATFVGTGNSFNFTVDNTQGGAERLFTEEGNYTIIANMGGCAAVMNGSADIIIYELGITLVDVTDVSCFGGSDGTITVDGFGGSGNYEYSIDGTNWQSSTVISGLATGDNQISIRDLDVPAAKCSEHINILTVTIGEPLSVLNANIVSTTNVGCTPCTAGVNCEGSATISISGGTPDGTLPDGYTIIWSTGGTALTETGMPVGNHSVTVTDANGCSTTIGVTIDSNAPLTLAEAADPALHNDNVCHAGVEGSYTVTATGGSGVYEFSLTDPATTAEVWLPANVGTDGYRVNGLSAGTYNIWVRDADPLYNRCITQLAAPVVITEPAALTLVEESQVGITCNGAKDGSFIVRAANAASGTYEFTTDDPAVVAVPIWNPANNGVDGYELALQGAGNYTVYVRDLANPTCGYVSVDVILIDISALSYSLVEHSNVSCNAGNNGRLEVLAQGGSGNYVYQWSNNSGVVISNDVFIENLDVANGPYELTITDVPNSCGPVIQTFTITEPAVLDVNTVSITDADCAGQATGTIEVDVVGGAEPYNISWSNGVANVETISGLAPGNYTITVVDDNECSYNNVAAPYVIAQLDLITLEIPTVVTNNICNGESNGSISVKVDGGSGDYQFRLEGPVIIDWANSSSATMDDFTFTGLIEGNYNLKVRDANNINCEYLVGTYALVDPAPISLVLTTLSDITCFGGNDGSITITASGGSGTYQFNVDNGGYNAGDNAAIFTINGLSAGNHTIWVRDSKAIGCDYQLLPIITLTQPEVLDLTVSSFTNASCNGELDGEVVLSATGGSGNYDYSKDGGLTWDAGLGAIHTYSNLSAGAYVFQVRDRDAVACAVDTETHTLTQPTDFATTCVTTDVQCFGEATGQLALTTVGGVGPFEYSIDGGTSWQASPITALSSGTYVIDVKDLGTGCEKSNQIAVADATINELANAAITIGAESITPVTCNGGTDGIINLQGNVSGGDVAPAGDYLFTWYRKGTPDIIHDQGYGMDQVTNLSLGTYCVIVEDDNGCTVTSSDYVVAEPSAWNVAYTPTNLTKYNGGDGSINVHTCSGSNGGYSITWEQQDGTPLPAFDNIWNVTNFDAGTYRFTITDSKGCTYTSIDITLSQPFEFTVTDPTTTSTNITCYGLNDGVIIIEIIQGNGDYTIDIVGTLEKGGTPYTNNFNQNTNTFVITDLEAGSYYIELTDNISSEIFISTVVLAQPDELTIVPVPTDIICYGENNGALSVELSGHIDGGTVSWTADNGYAVGPESILTATSNYSKTNLQAGTYTVTVTNGNGCPSVQAVDIIISEPSDWNVTTFVTPVTTFGHNDGTVEVDFPPTGNTAPYTIVWDNDPTLTSWWRSGLSAGDYQFTITDATGLCKYTDILTVTEPDQLLINLEGVDATCYDFNNGSIGVDIISGNADYQIELTGNDYEGNSVNQIINGLVKGNYMFTDLKSGNYDVIVTDAAGQTLSKSVTINQFAQLDVAVTSSQNIICHGGNDGEIEVETVGYAIDEANSTINWTRTVPFGWSATGSVATEKQQTGLVAGTYTINVQNEFGCMSNPLVITLTQPDAISASHALTHVSTSGATDGRILINNVENAIGAYSVSWYKDGVLTGVTGADNTNIGAGTYYYVIEDTNGCTYTSLDIIITEPGALVVSVTDTDINCYGAENGMITVNITSGNAPYSVSLNGVPDDGTAFVEQNETLTTSEFTGLKPGVYQVTVTDNASQTFIESSITITQNPETTITPTLSDITCHGGVNGRIEIALGGHEDGSETWQVINPNSAPVPTTTIAAGADATIPGNYQVIVTNQDGCTITETYTITEPSAWDVHHTVTHVSPTGNNNGEINIDVLTGNTPDSSKPEDYTIIWTGPVGATLVNDQRLQTGLPAGTYTYRIEDANGCIYDSGDIILSEPDALTANITESDVDIQCYGDALGEIAVYILSGNEPYMVQLTGDEYDGNLFSDSQTIANNTGSYLWDNLKAGDYQIQITDNAGNSFSQAAIILNQPVQNIINESITHLTCYSGDQGAGEISIQLNRNFLAGDEVIWSGPNGIINSETLSLGSDIAKLNVYTGGDYTYTFIDANGCTVSNTITINEPDAFNIDWAVSDVTVYGNNDGVIDVHTVEGSNGIPYSISWADDASISDFLRNDLVGGTYSFTITDTPTGCDTTITDVIVNQPNPLIVAVTTRDAVCFGEANGEVQVEFSSHNGGYYYQITGNQDDGVTYDSERIDPASVNSTVNSLKAGTYTIDAYDSKGTHYHQAGIRIEQEAEISLSGSIKDISCYGEADGRVIVTLDGRAPVSTDHIVWSGSKGTFVSGALHDGITYTNNVLDPIATSETFTVTVTSEQGCVYTNTYVVNEPDELHISIDDIKDVTCSGGNDGQIVTSVSGRLAAAYRYDWYLHDGTAYQDYELDGTATISGLSGGDYRLVVTSLVDNCTVEEAGIIVNDGNTITITEDLTHISTCVGDNSGIISVNVAGGIAPYTVTLNGQGAKTGDGTEALNFSELFAGTYVIEVFDARGASCAVSTKTVTILEPSQALSVINIAHDINCDPADVTSGSFSFGITGGILAGGNYNYQIALPEASLSYPISVANGTVKTEIFNNLEAGTYNLSILDLNSTDPAKCSFEYQFTLEHIVITNDPLVNTTCDGINNGAITGITIDGTSGDYSYAWTSTDGGIGIDNSSLNQYGLSVGNYVLTITDNVRGCSVIKEFIVDVENAFSFTPQINDVSCNGASDGAITLELNGTAINPTYQWTGPGISVPNVQNQLDLVAGNYTVRMTTVIDGVTCQLDADYTLFEPEAISFDTRYDYTNCEPFERTLVVENVNGGTGAYTYSWDGPAFTPAAIAAPGYPTSVLIEQGGVYTITVRDENNCELSRTLTVSDEIVINPVVNSVTCNGGANGSIVLNVSGGSGLYTFSWTGPSVFTSTDRNIDNLYAGTYTVTITDQIESDGTGSCSKTFDIVVEEPQAIVIDPTVIHTSCFGLSDGQIEIEVSGGEGPYTYSWSPVIGSNQITNKDQYELPADTYTVTVTDANYCVATANIDVLQDAEIILTTDITETICDGTGGAIDLTVVGGSGAGFSYDWSSTDGTGLVQGVEDQTNLTGGTYTVVVSDLGDGRSCTASTTFTITDGIEILNEDITPVSCSGNDDGSISYDVFGGDGNYIFDWNVKSGDATRIVVGAQNQSGLSEGEYEVTITDGRTDAGGTDCSMTHSFIINASTGLSVNVAAFDSKICFGEPGGRLEASVAGGSGDYSYYWNGALGTAIHDNLVQGIYGLRVVDNALGCDFVQSYEVKGPAAPLTIDNIDIIDVLCHGAATGEIKVIASGGVVPTSGDYIYTWTSGTTVATGSNPTGLMAGIYNLTIEDANECTLTTGDIEIKEPVSYIKVDNPQVTDVTVPGGSNGEIQVDVYDGVAPRSIEWFDESDVSIGTNNPITGLSAGTFRVVATDNNGCTAELRGIKVVEPGEALGFEKVVHQISPCNGENNGEIHITRVYGGFAIAGLNYRIQLSGPGVNLDINDTKADLVDLAPGTYQVTVTDNVLSTYQENIEIKEPAELTLSTVKVNDVDCFGSSSGEIRVTIGGGTPNASGYYHVEITSATGYFAEAEEPAGTFSFINLPAGEYTVTVFDYAEELDTKVPDRNNCYKSDFTLISEPAAVVELSSVSGSDAICLGDDYQLAITTSNWDFADGNLRVVLYDDFTATEYTVDKTPFEITVSPETSRTYELTKVYKPGNASCDLGMVVDGHVQLAVNELPTANITGPDQVCEDGSVQLSVNFTGAGPFTYIWQDINNGTSGTETGINTYSATFSDTPAADASYQVISVSDNNGCANSGFGQVDVMINNKPSVSLIGSRDICEGEEATLLLEFSQGAQPYTVIFEANGEEVTLNVTPDALSQYAWRVTPVVSTTYVITSVIDANGCEMDIVVQPSATITVNHAPGQLSAIKVDESDNEAGVCQGAIGVSYSVEAVSYATGGYDWTAPAGATIRTGDGSTSVTLDFDADFDGGYLTVYASNDCGISPVQQYWITAKPIPDAIITAPVGPESICELESGLVYTIDPVDNASYYEWHLPAGFIPVGNTDGTSIEVMIDPNYPSTTGAISVTPWNDCGVGTTSPELTVTVYPLPLAYAGNDEQVCSDMFVLQAAPLQANESGRWTVIKGSGQISDATNPNATVSVLSYGKDNQNTFVWAVQNTVSGCETSDTVNIYNNELAIAATAIQRVVCNGTAVVNGTAVPEGTAGSWFFITGNGAIESANAATSNISLLDAGLNVLRWSVTKNGCISSADVELVNDEPSDAIILNGSDINICTDNITLNAVVPVEGEGLWSLVSGAGVIASVNSATTLVSGMQNGENIFRYTVTKNSCTKYAEIRIFNSMLDVDAGSDKTTCSDTYTLDATPTNPSVGITGQWSIIDGFGEFNDGTNAITTITNLGRGENTLRWTLTQNGCASFNEVIITNNSATQATVGTRQEVCAYETVLTGNMPSAAFNETGFWSVIEGSGVFDDLSAHDTRVSGLAHGLNVFRWTIQHHDCSAFADIEIYNKHVDVYAGKDTIICGKTAMLNASVPNSDDDGMWTLIAGVGGATIRPGDEQSPTALVGALDYGSNGFVWTITHNGCTSSDEVYVINDNPYYVDSHGNKREVSAGDPIFVNGTTAVMVADAPAVGIGEWTLMSGGGTIADVNNAGTLITDLRAGESVFRWTVTNGICSYYSDVTITNGSIEEANAGRDASTCNSEILLSANEPIFALGEWSIIEGAGVFEDKTKFNTLVTGLDEGENHFVWTLYNGSTASSDVVIITNNAVVDANAGLNKSICNTDEFELSAIAPEANRGTVQWSVVSGSGSFDDDTSPLTVVRGLSQGANTLKYRISLEECYSEAYVTITNNTPTVPDAGEDLSICIDSVQLLPNTPAFGVGEWTVSSGYADPDALENGWAKKLAPGENRLVWTINNNNCTLSDELVITNNQPYQANAGEDITEGLCVDNTLLDAVPVLSGQGVGRWELVAGSGSISDSSNPKSEVNGLGLGVNRFRWIVDNNGCISTDEVNISNNHIEAIAGKDQVLCADTATLKANIASPGMGSWTVKAGAGSASFDDSSNPYTKVRGLQQGDNTLQWTISYGGCSHTSEVIITNDNPSVAFAGDNQSLCETNSTTLSANNPSVGDGVWSVINGSATFETSTTDNNSTINNLAFGDNVLRWTVTNNKCVSVSDVMISNNRIDAHAGYNMDLCSDEVQLEGSAAAPGIGTWSVVGGTSQAIFEDVNNPSSRVSNLGHGENILRWSVNYRGCETESVVSMTNNSPSTAYAGNYQELCGDNTILDATVPGIGVGRWRLLSGSGEIVDTLNAKTEITGLAKGDNVLVWSVVNGECWSEDVVRIVNNEPSIPYAGIDEETCSASITLKAKDALVIEESLWTIEEGYGNFDNPTSPTATISNLKPGVNVLKWTITRGQCQLSHSITVTNNAADIANAGPDITDCKDWSQLDANIPQEGTGIGEWSLVSGKGNFENHSSAKTLISELGHGDNILLWTITNGECISMDSVVITNRVPAQSFAGDDRVTCDDFIVLNSNDPMTSSGYVEGDYGKWTVISGQGVFEDEHQYNTMVTDIGYGENIYKWTISYGDCTTEDVVTVVSNKANAYAGEDDVTYEPAYTLQAQNPGALNGVWTIVAGGGTFDDTTFFNTTVLNLPEGKSTFRWTITTDGCEAYDEVTIDYKVTPEAGFTLSEEEGCFPFEVKFTNYSVGGERYKWDFGDGHVYETDMITGPEHTYENAGNYTAILTVSKTGVPDAIYTKRILVHDHPVADFNVSPEKVYLPHEEIRCYDMSVDAVRWFWEFGDGQTSDKQNPSYVYGKEGTYSITLTVQNKFGCEDSFTKEDAVEAINSGYVEFPNAFRPRPGGAGSSGTIGERNDAIFKSKNKDVEEFNIQIFNRWGQLIFESNDVNEGWDGTYKGQLAPQAVYVYKAFVRFTNGRQINKAGSVLLVR